MDPDIQIVCIPKEGVGGAIDACARGEITFGELERRIADMGYKTVGLYEQVRAAETEIKNAE